MALQLPDFEFSSIHMEEVIGTPESAPIPGFLEPVPPASTSTKGSHAMLTTIASEILIRIYENLDSFTSVLALSSVSRQFRELWITNSISTCPSVLSHTILCAKQAKEFIDIKRAYNSPRATGDRHRLAIEQTQEILRNHKIALIAMEHFRSAVVEEFKERMELTHEDAPTETQNTISKQNSELLATSVNCHDFLAAFYRFLTLCSLPPHLWRQIPQPYTSWTMLELERVEALMRWFRHGPINSRLYFAIRQRLNDHYEEWIQGLIDKLSVLIHFQWEKASTRKWFNEAIGGKRNVSRYLMLGEYYDINGWGRGPFVGEVLAEMNEAREDQDSPDADDTLGIPPNQQARSTWNLYTNPHHTILRYTPSLNIDPREVHYA